MRIGYKMSKDYSRLKELLDKGYSVVCTAETKIDSLTRNVFCVAELKNKGLGTFEHYAFLHGKMVALAYNDDMVGQIKDYPKTFEDMMKLRDVQFIDINV